MLKKSLTKRLIIGLALSGCFWTGLETVILAQGSNPGLTIFSGVDRKDILSYFLDFGGNPGGWDRYRLRVPAKKVTQPISKFTITYPDYYDGKFSKDDIEIRVEGKSLPLQEVILDQENHFIEIVPQESIPSGTAVEIVLSNVKNPPFGGTYYFNCNMLSATDIPISLYLGTWILSIGRN